MKAAKAKRIRNFLIRSNGQDSSLEPEYAESAATNIVEFEPLQKKVRGAFQCCLNCMEQAVLTMRYRLNEFELPVSPESSVQPPVPVRSANGAGNGHNGNGKHCLSDSVLQQLALMNPDGGLRPHDEVALVCGMPYDVVEATEIEALRKLMGYGKKLE